MANEMRVQKFLSKAGVCSRRKGEKLMQSGRVQVNGEACTELGSKVVPGRDEVRVDGDVVTLPQQYVYILLNKPENYITSLDDPKGRPVITDLIPDNMPRIWPVGRLDWDSSGALLMTNDGKLTNLLTHPSHDVTKQYAVKVRGLLTNDSSKLDRLRKGINLDGVQTKPAHIEVIKDNGNNTWLEFIITEGKNRQIRRMCKAIGYPVMKLRRYAVGPITLDKVPSGAYRPLLHEEVEALYEEVEADMPERATPSASALKRERKLKKRHGKYDVRTHGPGKKHH
jgi:23S rRNA pseudouridine2605 synthase